MSRGMVGLDKSSTSAYFGIYFIGNLRFLFIDLGNIFIFTAVLNLIQHTMKKLFITLNLILGTVAMFAQTLVDTIPSNRNVVLEEFTGIHCVYCPDGHKKAQDLKNAHPNDVFLINIHEGGYATPSTGEPDFRTSFGTAIASQSVLAGYPAGTINRHRFPGFTQNTTSATATATSRSVWAQLADTIMSWPSYVNIGMSATIDASTRILTVNVELYYTANGASNMNLNVALIQDNVEGPQTGGSTYNPTQVLPNGNYNHMHMLRHMLTGQWGDTVTTTAAGSFVQRTYTYTLPSSITSVPLELGNLELVAFVCEGQQEVITGTGVVPTYTNIAYANNVSLDEVATETVICEGSLTPEIRFVNVGSAAITSATIQYSVNGGTASTYNWTGNLATFGSDNVTLPAITFTPLATNSLVVTITSVNGAADQDNTNNSVTVSNIAKTTLKTSGLPHKVTIVQDRYGSEISWEVVNSAGTTVASGGPYSDLSANGTATHEHDFNLSTVDCYTLYVYDSYGDGFNAGYGVGSYKFQNAWATLVSSNGKIGSMDKKPFEMLSVVGIEENAEVELNAYPNPAFDAVSFDFNFKSSENVSLEVYSTLGQVVKSVDFGSLTGAQKLTVDVKGMNAGVYFFKFNVGEKTYNKQVTVQ